jgi:hypothetical protein
MMMMMMGKGGETGDEMQEKVINNTYLLLEDKRWSPSRPMFACLLGA